MELAKIKQRLEILWQEVEKLEAGGGGSPTDAYTKAQTDALLNTKADKSTTYTKSEVDYEIDSEVGAAIADLDVSSTAATGHVIRSIAQEDGKIAAVAELVDTTPTPSSVKLCTSGGIYDAIQAAGGGGTDLTPTVITLNSSGDVETTDLPILEKHLPIKIGENGLTYTFLGDFGGFYWYYTFGNSDLGQDYKGFKINKTTGVTTTLGESGGAWVSPVLSSNIVEKFYNKIGNYPTSTTTGDLNNKYNAGVYYINNASNVSNYPTTETGLLYVDKNYPNCIIQTLTTTSGTPTIFIRVRQGATWTSWYKFEGTVVS